MLQYGVLQLEVTYQCKADGLLQRERHAIERLQKQQEVGDTRLSLMATVCLVSRVSRSNKRWVTHGSVSWQQYVLCPELAEATRGGSHTAQSHGNSMSCVQS